MVSSNSNFQLTVESSQCKTPKKGGRVRTRHRQVAMLLASGLSTKEIEKQTGMSASRIYHLTADQDSFVNQEIHRIQNETCVENTRLLPNLLNKALRRLDEKLGSSDNGDQFKAINQIIKICNSKNGIPRVTAPDEKTESPDDIIIRNRKERGLPLKDDEDDDEATK